MVCGFFSSRCRFVQHVSLEDPPLRMFVGECLDNVLRQLGMDKDEPLESQMVARGIRSAQEKIEQRAIGNAAASSAQDWLERNCPNL
jgi:preprotein translocase subunit SecA